MILGGGGLRARNARCARINPNTPEWFRARVKGTTGEALQKCCLEPHIDLPVFHARCCEQVLPIKASGEAPAWSTGQRPGSSASAWSQASTRPTAMEPTAATDSKMELADTIIHVPPRPSFAHPLSPSLSDPSHSNSLQVQCMNMKRERGTQRIYFQVGVKQECR